MPAELFGLHLMGLIHCLPSWVRQFLPLLLGLHLTGLIPLLAELGEILFLHFRAQQCWGVWCSWQFLVQINDEINCGWLWRAGSEVALVSLGSQGQRRCSGAKILPSDSFPFDPRASLAKADSSRVELAATKWGATLGSGHSCSTALYASCRCKATNHFDSMKWEFRATQGIT